ncbi:hypothetical protein [Burkholderia cenocepacia]|uniref:hypothetical protein n=1 Tax=Burkholderia cenocepacia TaxID=95486 RepID=UPI001F4A80B3|nr:hypothetical protein [Burkholderia cenocepacia]
MQAQVETPVVDPAEPATPLETSFGNEQPVIAVPYSSLHPSPLNARTRPLSGIEGLAANYEKLTCPLQTGPAGV